MAEIFNMDDYNNNELSSEDFEDEMDDNFITMQDQNGNDVVMELLDVIEYEDEEYAVLFPDDHEVDDNVIILKLIKNPNRGEEDDYEYSGIDDEELMEKIFEIFKERNKDDYNFTDGE